MMILMIGYIISLHDSRFSRMIGKDMNDEGRQTDRQTDKNSACEIKTHKIMQILVVGFVFCN